MRDATGRLQLKSKLLVSAAGLAAAAMSTAAAAADAPSATASSPPSDPPKWSPYADIGGGVGSGFVVGKVNVFAPVWQDLDSLLFVRLGVGTSTRDNENFNLGLGYRTKIDPDWILGVFGGFDSTQANNNHSFTQVSLGAELMSADWDVRVNGYSAKKDESAVGNKFALYIHDTTIAILDSQFGAYSGFDGEVGYRVFNTDSTDVRLFAGGYDFSRSTTDNTGIGGNLNFSHKDIAGPRGRAEVNIFNIDALGPQSRVSFDGEIAHDDVRGTTGYVGATLRIALNDSSGGGAQALDDLDRRMVDPVRRADDVLVRQSFDKPEPVIIYNGHITSQPTNTLFYVDNTAGTGSYANPTTLQDATSRGPTNQFIVLTDRNGPVNSTGVTVQSGESVVGPGTFEVRGVHSGTTFTHDFAPGSGPVSLFSTGPTVLTLDSVTNLYGFTINGPFTDAIYGHNITDVTISGVTIDGTAGGVNGIHIVQDVSGDSTININDSTITNVSNDGIYVNNTFSDGGTSNEHLHLDNVTISGAGNDGIYVNSNITGGSTANLTTELTSSSVSGAANGVLMSATVGVGSSATQNIIIDPTTITGGLYGVNINGVADGGTLNQYVGISDVTFSGQTVAGVAVFAYAENGGSLTQTANLTNVNVTGSYFPVAMIANAASGGHATQNFSLTDVTVTGGVFDGIDIVAAADGAGSVAHQYGNLDHVTVTGTVDGYGVYADAEATNGGTTVERLDVSNLTATGNYYDNIRIIAGAYTGSTVHQYVSLTNVNASDSTYGFGLNATVESYGNSTATQSLVVDGLTATGNYYGALRAGIFAGAGSSAGQYVSITNSTLEIGALDLYADGFNGANVKQYVSVTNSTLVGNDLPINVDLYASDSDVSQGVYLTNVGVSGGTFSGITIDSYAYGASTAKQTVIVHALNGSTGPLSLSAYADGATLTQDVMIDGANFNGGFDVNARGFDGANVTQLLSLTNATLTGNNSPIEVFLRAFDSNVSQGVYVTNVGAGGGAFSNIEIDASAFGTSTATQVVNLYDLHASTGQLYVQAYAGDGDAILGQDVRVSDLDVTAGAIYPVEVYTYAKTGGAITSNFSLTNVTVDGGHYGYDGIHVATYADGVGSSVHQTLSFTDVTATNSLFDGVDLYARAAYGATVIQHASISGLTATGNYSQGVYVHVVAGYAAATAAQYVSVTDSNLAGNYLDFVAAAVGINDATARQDIYVGNTVLSDMAHSGVQSGGAIIDAYATNGGSVQQTAYFANDTVQGNLFSGITISAESRHTGFVEQTVQIYGTPTTVSEISNNGAYGVIVTANASAGGDIEQNIDVYYVNASHNGLGGLAVNTNSYGIATGYALYYSHVSQNIIAFGDHFDNNGGNGVSVINNAQYGAGIDQFVYVGNSTVNNNAGDGIHVESHDIGASSYGYAPGTHLYSDVYVFNSDVSHNGGNGISVESDVTMPTDPTKVFGDSYLEQHVVISGTTANYNGNDGFIDNASATGIYSLNLQYVTLQGGSTFNHNQGNGAEFTATDYFGPYSFGAVLQEVTVNGAAFNYNAGDGIHATTDASGFQGRAEQYFSIFNASADGNGANGMSFYNHSHDGAYYPGFGCNYVQGLTGGCAIVRQTVQIGYSDISNNAGNGIYVGARVDNYGSLYAKSGRPLYASSFFIEDSTVDSNGGDGLHLYNYVANHSYGYQYVVALDTNFNGNAGSGISALNNVTGNSALIQKFVVYGLGTGPGSEINNNGGAGITIDSQATNGGKIGNLLIVGYSAVDGNAGNGISVTSGADSGAGTADTGVAQYITVLSSDVSGNGTSLGGGYGINMNATATGAYAVISQYLTLTNSTVNNNGSDGVHAFAIAYNGAAANQNLYFANDTISNNHGDGVYVVGIAVDQSFTAQTVNFGYNATGITNITANTGDGIYLGTAAFSGANAEQNDFIYHVNASNNGGDGLGIGAGTNGYSFGSSYIYYSHVSQNVIAAYDTFDHNAGNGMSVSDVAYYGGAMNQLVEAIAVDMSNNTGAGFYQTSHLTSIRGNSFSFSTNENTMLYLINDTMNHNTGNGIDIRSYANGAVYAPAFFGGYNYVQHHDTISGTTANYNGGSGLSVNTSTVGRYSLNGEYLTISGSTFDHNGGDGATFTSNDYYGPGGFGVSLQQVTISGSDFSYNTGNGLTLNAFASGTQGRAEQHFTVSSSTFDNNGGDGVHIYASAINGTYVAGHPCDTAQGLPGGCAFVRQNVVIEGSDISHNGNDGVNVITYANNYGAIYGVSGRPHSPTLELYGTTVDYNSNRGLNVSNHVSGNSYLYQYVAAIDSTFDHNQADGVYAASYVGGASTMLQRVLLYSYHTGASASYDGGNGFKSSIEALGGSYARDVNVVEGVDLSNDGSFGFDGAVAYADGTSTGLQINAVYFNTINTNGDGVGLYSIGAGAQQISYIGGNTITGNAFVGVYGEANFGAFQYIGVYTFGNTVNSNGTNYLFNSFGGSTQILN